MTSINATFERDMVEFATKAKSALQDMTKMVLMDIAFSLVEKSPVADPPTWKRQPTYLPATYRPGTFKNNWQLGVDGIPSGTILGADPTGNLSIDRIRLAIPRWAAGHVYYFVNNLPYAQALEDGWSRQAPLGMVSLTMMDYQTIVEDVQIRYSQGERPSTKAIPK